MKRINLSKILPGATVLMQNFRNPLSACMTNKDFAMRSGGQSWDWSCSSGLMVALPIFIEEHSGGRIYESWNVVLRWHGCALNIC